MGTQTCSYTYVVGDHKLVLQPKSLNFKVKTYFKVRVRVRLVVVLVKVWVSLQEMNGSQSNVPTIHRIKCVSV